MQEIQAKLKAAIDENQRLKDEVAELSGKLKDVDTALRNIQRKTQQANCSAMEAVNFMLGTIR